MNEVVGELLREAAAQGLQVQLPLGAGYDDRAPAGLRLRELAPWARGGVLLLSAGDTFYSRFAADPTRPVGADPLDRFTRSLVESLLSPVRQAGIRAEARHPFWNEPAPLDFRRIGLAAGLPLAPPLGLHLHPDHGTWLAYRALLLFDVQVEEGRLHTVDACTSCPAPCVQACPAGAVEITGWDPLGCTSHRLATDDGCAGGCHARLACPVGAGSRYGEEALCFHQVASLAGARAWHERQER